MKRILQNAVPVLLVMVLLIVLYQSLFSNPTHEMPSTRLNQPIPTFSMSNVLNNQQVFSNAVFSKQSIAILNIWATWCYACRIEHSVLMKIKNEYHIPVYGIAYKDDQSMVLSWLKKRGNPYDMLGLDNTGDVAIDFGIYGTPETFVIDQKGVVLYRHVGTLTEDIWQSNILPIIKQHEDH